MMGGLGPARTGTVWEIMTRGDYVSIEPEIRWSEQQEMMLGKQPRDIGLFRLG